MRNIGRTPRCCGILLVMVLCLGAVSASAATSGRAMLETARVQGGLVVHVGCSDGKLTASLCPSQRYLVQGLERDPQQVEAGRKHIRSLGLYGRVSVRHWDSPRMPYGDNLVNLVVISSGQRIAAGEIERVLAPQGNVLVQGPLETRGTKLVAQPAGLEGWNLYRKPLPEDIDQWTHYLHDAGNNAVAEDDRVGPPRQRAR